MTDRPLWPEGVERFPNTDYHPASPETDELGITTIAVALDPPPPREGWTLDAPVAVRAELTWTGVFRWWCLGRLHPQYKVVLVRAEDSYGWVLSGLDDTGDHGVKVGKHPAPYPPPPSPTHDTMASYSNWDLAAIVGDAPGHYWVMGTVDGRRTKPIHFRRLADPDTRPVRDVLVPAKIEARLDPETLLLRGTLRAGVHLPVRKDTDLAAEVLLVVTRVQSRWTRPPDWDRPMPHTGDLVPDADVRFLKLSDLAGTKLRPDGPRLAFEAELAGAPGLDKPGRYWVLVTADGEIGEAIDFEVR